MPSRLAIPIAVATLLAPLAASSQPQPDPAVAIVPERPSAAAPASAAAPPPAGAWSHRPYLVLRPGVFSPRGEEEGPNSGPVPSRGGWGFDDAFALEVGVGARLARLLTGELAVGHTRTRGMRRGFDPVAYETATENVRLGILSVSAALRAFAPIPGRFRAYGVVGGGLHRVDVDYDWNGVASGPEPALRFTDTPFGLDLGAGVGWAFTPRIRLDVEAKHTIVRATFGGERLKLDGLRAGAGLQLQL